MITNAMPRWNLTEMRMRRPHGRLPRTALPDSPPETGILPLVISRSAPSAQDPAMLASHGSILPSPKQLLFIICEIRIKMRLARSVK